MEKEKRLKKTPDFKKAFREGKRFLSPHFVLYIHKNSLTFPRLGVSISKGHFKFATRRNRLRRVATGVFRTQINPDLSGYDFVVASRRNTPGISIKQATEELRELLSGQIKYA